MTYMRDDYNKVAMIALADLFFSHPAFLRPVSDRRADGIDVGIGNEQVRV